ncbi:HTH-type transcriptional regulator CdhR [Aliiroseovarius sp. xm-m-379]|uniref:GlxA family transcriptional regulator n=1 Tax=unclassified Aliiroseovarius TaxID=2623558 RepID=UPI0015689D15|nr:MULTISPECIES: helix-turn-helix domain-containing protein [unclassified Aliiroseovarius]NRP11330.1 HTH-type transcriptional regulator CdhR [Aliiroseovarius sp. xm-d-517]NRP23825.1 HTH-type transcriptional regulator CdhR [Aliiroseovarius sp. xm-m-379]NRP28928.1 HTH-type transcriptional regulator CdhR [Aliiroseovarius sp. xm-m-314]NRP32624.1 HTH-type transcriptional regulator CdhR [Aliiroseovarius sp. xm-a-104]NRP42577.1 HTH-type transcriptional regulator CdhR [Aliiroseovarius sp. xm-m-339-2]
MPDEISQDTDTGADPTAPVCGIEIFVQPGFWQIELAAILSALNTANDVCGYERFPWQITSDHPGIVHSNGDMMVRAGPSIGEQYLRQVLVVIGGTGSHGGGWMARLRAMQKIKRRVVLLSGAATEYIKATNPRSHPVTTNWGDVNVLSEGGDYPTLTTHLAEDAGGIMTCAGGGHTLELMVAILSEQLAPQEAAELAAQLMLEHVRGPNRDQPKGMSHSSNFLEKRLQSAIRLMEETVEHPLKVSELAQKVGVSTRQLERLFLINLDETPAKFYKKIRLKRAQALITDTRMPLIDVALACGFSDSSSLARAYRLEYAKTPNQLRGEKGKARG